MEPFQSELFYSVLIKPECEAQGCWMLLPYLNQSQHWTLCLKPLISVSLGFNYRIITPRHQTGFSLSFKDLFSPTKLSLSPTKCVSAFNQLLNLCLKYIVYLCLKYILQLKDISLTKKNPPYPPVFLSVPQHGWCFLWDKYIYCILYKYIHYEKCSDELRGCPPFTRSSPRCAFL